MKQKIKCKVLKIKNDKKSELAKMPVFDIVFGVKEHLENFHTHVYDEGKRYTAIASSDLADWDKVAKVPEDFSASYISNKIEEIEVEIITECKIISSSTDFSNAENYKSALEIISDFLDSKGIAISSKEEEIEKLKINVEIRTKEREIEKERNVASLSKKDEIKKLSKISSLQQNIISLLKMIKK